ncbi:MAG: metallophosphoesterase family protein [Pseudomonadota bacterium]
MKFKPPFLSTKPKAQVPDGAVVYAIGDVHGRLDLLEEMFATIDADAHGRGEAHVILLGDLVDRGPDTAGVLEACLKRRDADPRTQFLRGNHEQALLDFLDGAEGSDVWLEWGGLETAASYWVAASGLDLDELREALKQKIPASHLDFIRTLPLYTEIGDYIFVHAGLRPGVPLEEQEADDLLWIRSEFHKAPEAAPGRVVVHGHHRQRKIANEPGRIGVDTGAVLTGRLTAVALEGDRRWFLTVEGPPSGAE